MLLRLFALHAFREMNNPALRILGSALWLCVFATTLVFCFTTAFRMSSHRDIVNLLGADLILEAPNPLDPQYAKFAQSIDLRMAGMVEFFSMVMADNKLQLATVVAIDHTFPLRGQLKVIVKDLPTTQWAPPPKGQVWIDENLASKLEVKLNDVLSIGDSQCTISGIIKERPSATSESYILAPVLYVNAADISKMAVLQTGSRATYRLLFAGDAQNLAALINHFKNDPMQGSKWITPTEGRPALSRMLSYIERYLTVIMMVQAILAATVIALSAHQYSVSQQKKLAIWRCLGASSTLIVVIPLLALSLGAVLILITSISAAYLTALCIVHFSQHYIIDPGISLAGAGGIFGALTGIIMLFGFAFPPVWSLRRLPCITILQQNVVFVPQYYFLSYLIASLLLGIIFIGSVIEKYLVLKLAAQLLLVGIIIVMLAWGMWYILGSLSQRGPLILRFAFSHLVRHKRYTITQSLVFSMVTMMLILLQIIQHDFLTSWKTDLPANTPNYFLVNIQPDKVISLQRWLKKQGIAVKFYPIVRAQLTQVNNQKIPKARDMQRLINLTWMSSLPTDNRVVAGVEWPKDHEKEIGLSVEIEFAKRQQLQLGDKLRFDIAGQEIEGKIVQFRAVEWESFKPNFFVIFPPDVLEQFPHSYITSIYLPAIQKKLLLPLSHEYVELSIIDIDGILQKVREITAHVSSLLELILFMVFIMGVLILYVQLLVTVQERLQESALLQILGARKYVTVNILLIEYLFLGVFSGFVASIMALLLAKGLAREFFTIPFNFSIKWLGLGTVTSATLIALFGLIGARSIFRVSPLLLLRQTT